MTAENARIYLEQAQAKTDEEARKAKEALCELADDTRSAGTAEADGMLRHLHAAGRGFRRLDGGLHRRHADKRRVSPLQNSPLHRRAGRLRHDARVAGAAAGRGADEVAQIRRPARPDDHRRRQRAARRRRAGDAGPGHPRAGHRPGQALRGDLPPRQGARHHAAAQLPRAAPAAVHPRRGAPLRAEIPHHPAQQAREGKPAGRDPRHRPLAQAGPAETLRQPGQNPQSHPRRTGRRQRHHPPAGRKAVGVVE